MKRVYKYTTIKEHSRFLWWLPYDLEFDSQFLKIEKQIATVKEGYSWDGATPKFKIFGKIYGTWDGKNDEARTPTMWHDVFTQYQDVLKSVGLSRLDTDLQFREDLISYGHPLPNLYYAGVRAFGWWFWI